VKASGPKPGASTNFATRAALELQNGEGAPDGPPISNPAKLGF
jgi:hypothetical protein